ncbi:hypothetical protein A6R68_05540, partial [Neotoma lepida]
MSLALRNELAGDKTNVKQKKRELSEEQKQEMKDAFKLLIQTKVKPWTVINERESTSKITFEEFNEVMSDLILEGDSHEELVEEFKLLHDDDSGNISLRNF